MRYIINRVISRLVGNGCGELEIARSIHWIIFGSHSDRLFHRCLLLGRKNASRSPNIYDVADFIKQRVVEANRFVENGRQILGFREWVGLHTLVYSSLSGVFRNVWMTSFRTYLQSHTYYLDQTKTAVCVLLYNIWSFLPTPTINYVLFQLPDRILLHYTEMNQYSVTHPWFEFLLINALLPDSPVWSKFHSLLYSTLLSNTFI